jgi:hypothetical protein
MANMANVRSMANKIDTGKSEVEQAQDYERSIQQRD